ncbi:MAG: hypothetical protein NZZ41_05005 [Candidatus Dojkabacteria bacterium]|nr:hypothetical protein [Candidatus Dojkabacteria bacterium]
MYKTGIIDIFITISILICFLILLIKSAKQLENNIITISKKLKLKEFFLGFLLIGIFTNLPEIAVAIFSVNQNTPSLSVGNLFGGATVLLTLVFGLVAIKFKKIAFKRPLFTESELVIGLLQLMCSLIFISDGYLSIVESLSILIFYLLYIRYISHHFQFKFRDVFKINLKKFLSGISTSTILSTILSVGLLIIAANFIVELSENLAILLGIPLSLFGLLLLGIGTNLPEIAILLTTDKHDIKEKNLTTGIILGSVFVRNGILGIVGILSGGFILEDKIVFIPTIVILCLTNIIFLLFTWRDRDISREEGLLLVSLYAALMISESVIIFNNLNI